MAATLRLIQRFLPVTGAAYRWQQALGQAPKDVPSAPERVMPWTAGKSPSGGSWQDKGSLWQGQGGFGAETPTYSSHPLPSPRDSVSKDDLMGFLSLIFALQPMHIFVPLQWRVSQGLREISNLWDFY